MHVKTHTKTNDTVLVTGGTGYIASHAVVSLIEQGMNPILLDNLSNSKATVIDRIEQITGVRPVFLQRDLRDREALDSVFSEFSIDSVVHFAGLKAVGESVQQAQRYYDNNVVGTLTLTAAMRKAQCFNLVFSSSATVYGDPQTVPITEDMPLSATNPYGRSKLMIEQILSDLAISDGRWRIALLRYFNPVGAHQSGLIGEDPNGIPNNLLPYIAQVAVGKLARLSVFGGDYDTADGTGVRDYIHVVDLVEAHIRALNNLQPEHGCRAYNLGTGQGYTVLEVVKAFADASGIEIPYDIVERRPGDICASYASPAFSEKKLGWRARFDLEAMMRDHWRWQSQNPNGYE